MKDYLRRKLRTGFVALATALVLTLLGAQQAFAQGPCISSDPAINTAIANLEAQGATVTCDDHNMYVQFPNGLYFMLTVADGGMPHLFFFDPVTGVTANIYVTSEGTLLIQHSVYGFINAGDGWFSIFYPIGNPFSAAIQNPMQAMFASGMPSDPGDPFYTGGGGGPPSPILPP